MGIKHTCHTCDCSGNSKCKQFILCDIDTDGFRCDTVVTGRGDGTSASGVYQVLDDKQSKKNQDHTNQEEIFLDIFV